MKTIYKIIIYCLVIFTTISCDNTLDVNTNPNYPSEASVEMLIPSGIAWTSSRLGSDLELLGSLWAQHYAQNNASNQYTNYDSYNILNTNLSGVWSAAYSGALPDLYLAKEKAEKDSDFASWIIAQVLIAFNYHILADFYETIPLSEALNENIAAPKYDEGKEINASIIAMLDEAIAKKGSASEYSPIENRDFVFKGDVSKWIEFAKTLKLKILLRDFSANQTAITALLNEGGFLTTDDAKMNGFMDKENNSNPLYENDRRKLNTPNNLRASATMVAFLLEYNDPRISAYYENAQAEGTDPYKGLPQGGYTIEQTIIPSATLSRARLAPEDPVYFMSVAESNFLQAESYARLGNKTKAKEFYDLAVTKAFDRWGFADQANDFLIGAYLFDDTNVETMLKSIITQKWVASVRCQAWDAFFDINRTGYPKLGTTYPVSATDWTTPNPLYIIGELTPSVNSVISSGEFPRRILIPKNSSDNNPNAPAVIPLTKKMWWHK
ncbi:SusD/RagB family nutrient-binding outer membrane lipoprotein [Parabacteroides sp. Marseille-P3160]|uniref:SusD/RagB family nutrient-binding outer membrane lipoprotein n=1 Tax=Parabacteroides sp. Marseille-P3160 TaxID=1917887 RepID=UPI0009B96041|nr:SusD/RagB family nutrient-binding outer membrane lipoprotein [Parabacteroides sp. Marseille-P3160]